MDEQSVPPGTSYTRRSAPGTSYRQRGAPGTAQRSVHNSSQRPQSRHGGVAGGRPGNARPPASLHCNRCRRPLHTDVFVLKCDCIFCEACTKEHFSSSECCPVCNTKLRETDFIQLCIAEPGKGRVDQAKAFQEILTKYNTNGPSSIPHRDMVKTLEAQLAQNKRTAKFVFKQIISHYGWSAKQHQSYAIAKKKLDAKNTKHLQEQQTKRSSWAQKLKEMDDQNASLRAQLSHLEEQARTKQNNIDSWREEYSVNSNDNNSRTSETRSSGRGLMEEFNRNKKKQEEAAMEELLHNSNRKRPFLGMTFSSNASMDNANSFAEDGTYTHRNHDNASAFADDGGSRSLPHNHNQHNQNRPRSRYTFTTADDMSALTSM